MITLLATNSSPLKNWSGPFPLGFQTKFSGAIMLHVCFREGSVYGCFQNQYFWKHPYTGRPLGWIHTTRRSFTKFGVRRGEVHLFMNELEHMFMQTSNKALTCLLKWGWWWWWWWWTDPRKEPSNFWERKNRFCKIKLWPLWVCWLYSSLMGFWNDACFLLVQSTFFSQCLL